MSVEKYPSAQVTPGAGRLLAQLIPDTTSPVTLWENTGDDVMEITLITLTQISGSSQVFGIYHNPQGTTYADIDRVGSGQFTTQGQTFETSARFMPNFIGGGIMVAPGGSIGIEVDSANQVTAHIYGIEAP